MKFVQIINHKNQHGFLTKVLILACILTLGLQKSEAQQDPQYSQYMFNMLLVNPAYAGSRDVLSATALYRRQWWGIDGAPTTLTFSVDMPIKREKIGIGVVVSNDRIGKMNTTNLSGYFAYRIKINTHGTLAMGLTGGGSFYNADLGSTQLGQGASVADPSFNGYASAMPLIGSGAYYSTDKYYFGVSLPNLLSYNLVRASETTSEAQKYQHVFLMAGYVFVLNKTMTLKPSALFKWVKGAPTQFDLNANLWFYDKFSFGLSGRSDASNKVLSTLNFLLEWQATENFRFGYAYDFPINNTYKISYQTHELMLRYEMGTKSRKTISPRYF